MNETLTMTIHLQFTREDLENMFWYLDHPVPEDLQAWLDRQAEPLGDSLIDVMETLERYAEQDIEQGVI